MISSEEIAELFKTSLENALSESIKILSPYFIPLIVSLIVAFIIGFLIKKLIYFYCTVTGTNKRETRKKIKFWNSIVDLFLNIVDFFKNDK